VNMTEDQLKGAPKFNRNTDWDWSDRSRDRTINDDVGQEPRLVVLDFSPVRLPGRALYYFGANARCTSELRRLRHPAP
jgi:hypothetical protein